MPRQQFTYHQRQQLRQLVVEAEILRLNIPEALSYIKGKSQLEISQEYFYSLKRIIKHGSLSRLREFQHSQYAYLYQFFKRIDEIEKMQQTLWHTVLTNPNDGMLKKVCISELHQLTITLANLYEMLPEYSSAIAANPKTTPENLSNSTEQNQSQRIFA